jgi:hypothetical protein
VPHFAPKTDYLGQNAIGAKWRENFRNLGTNIPGFRIVFMKRKIVIALGEKFIEGSGKRGHRKNG